MKTLRNISITVMVLVGKTLAVILGWIVTLTLHFQVLSCVGRRNGK